jgi:hypothetical protein
MKDTKVKNPASKNSTGLRIIYNFTLQTGIKVPGSLFMVPGSFYSLFTTHYSLSSLVP